jgi:hypothetical protein
LETRFYRLGELNDIEQSILSKRRAIDLTPDGHPDMSGRLIMLVRAIRSRNSLDSIVECLGYLLRAADQQSGPPSIRLQATVYASNIAWPASQAQFNIVGLGTLVSIYERAFKLIPLVAWLGKSIGQRYEDLAQIGQLVTASAAAAITIGDLPRAVEWLDQGRGVVWGQLLQLRNPMDDLRAHDTAHGSTFTERLQSVSRELESSAHHNSTSIEDRISARIRLEEDYRSLLHDVRALDGFKKLLMPKKYAELACAYRDGPVIIINVHKARCDALVITHSVDRPLHIPLPGLSLELANSMRSKFLSLLQQARFWERAAVGHFPRENDDARGLL